MKTLKLIPILFAGSIFSFTACDKDDSPNSTTETGSFKARMTDAPGDYESLTVEIVQIDAYLENYGWLEISNETQVVSVLELTNGAEAIIAHNSAVKAGTYSKIRLIFGDENQLTVKDSTSSGLGTTTSTHELTFTSSKEVTIEIDEEVSASTTASVLLDFHVVPSVDEGDSQYYMDPVITFVEDESTGMQGSVEGSAHVAVVATSGDDTLSTYTDVNGQFLIRGAGTGIYDMTFIPSTESGQNNILIDNVLVVNGNIKQLGTVSF